MIHHMYKYTPLWLILLLTLFLAKPASICSQNYYPVHVTVQALPPYGVYLSDYYSGSRDRLVVTLLNRDKEQRPLQVKLRIQIRNGSMFRIQSREELHYPMLTLESGVPLRLTSVDLAAYLTSDKIRMEGYLKEGKLPSGMTEFSVQAMDYVTGRVLSDYGTGRAWLEIKQPPLLNLPLQDEQIAYRTPQQIRFQWMPRHQGLANTVYEFTLKELPNNGVAPQSAFAYGQDIYRIQTRFTTLNYTHLEPLLIPGKRYGWQVRAIAKDGIDEIGMFENNGYSEIGWFEVNDNCPAPMQITARGGYRKMTLAWESMPEQSAFLVEYRPKSEHSLYEWTSTRTFDKSFTAYQLTPGWVYEYRVGALCMTEKPVYSPIGEITLSQDNEERLKQCGVMPMLNLSNQTGKENLNVGDVVIIGRDFPMTLTQVSSQGNGWYSGKGWITLPWIFEIKVAVKFNRLRVNTDNQQIGGEVETETDPNASQIANTNELDYGGSKTNSAKVVFLTRKVDFTMPEVPDASYNTESGELTVFDTNGEPHIIATQKNDGESIFPMIIEDKEGNKYQVDMPNEDGTSDAEQYPADTGGQRKPTITPIGNVSSEFDTGKLSEGRSATIRFTKGKGKYAFDSGKEPWYQSAQLLKQYYQPLASDYIAPWKLVPIGENDVVEAELTGATIDKQKVKFVLKDRTPLPARLEKGKWQISLPSVKAGETYEVFALYEEKKGKTQTLGKLGVVSYPKQNRTITLVTVDGTPPDLASVEEGLNRIYNPYGVSITVNSDNCLKGNKEWDADRDGRLNLNGSGFFSKETDEMKALRKLYQQTSDRYDRNSYYIFVVDKAIAGNEPDSELAVQGDMPRGKQFGYIFTQEVSNTPRLIAHELGHGIFTLRHSFDVNYSGDKFKATTSNLMDYNNGEELAVWQWNILANPAPLTWFDSEEDDKLVTYKKQIYGQSSGIAPNGTVIINFCSSNTEYKVVHLIARGSYCIQGFHLIDHNGIKIKSYLWNAEKKDYFDGKQSISEAKEVLITYYKGVDNTPVKSLVYRSLGDSCYYQYATVMHISGSDKIQEPAANAWKTEMLFNASDECRDIFIKELIQQILDNDRNDCSYEDIQSGIKNLKALTGSNNPQELVNAINNVCLSALRNLSYDEITRFLVKIASQEKLKEESELAILRLMNALDTKDYKKFYALLETNQNKLIRYLVDQMHDTSIYFWTDKNNYTNFIGALVTMFKNSPDSYLERIAEVGEDKLLGQVFYLYSQPFRNEMETQDTFSPFTSMHEFRFSGEYNKTLGTVKVIQEEKVLDKLSTLPPRWVETSTVAESLSPLTPILISSQKELPLIATALDAQSDETRTTIYVVPAIFLKYKGDKTFNDEIERLGMTTLDIATITASGGMALATKVGWVKRLWALSEIAGAISNIAVNTQTVTDPEVKKVVDIYNLSMGMIGLGHAGKGIITFSKNLPPHILKTIHSKSSIRSFIIEKYLEWNSTSMKFKSPEANIDAQLRELLILQESALGQLAGKTLRKFNNPEEIAMFLRTKENGAFFWSGRTSKGEGVMNIALEIAQKKGGNTLEGMLGQYNIEMPIWNATVPSSVKIWEDVSALYASQVSGEVRAILGQKLRIDNIWEKIELPRLKKNPNVTKITTIDPETMNETIIYTK